MVWSWPNASPPTAPAWSRTVGRRWPRCLGGLCFTPQAEVIADPTAAKQRLTGRSGGPVPLILQGEPASEKRETVQFVPVPVTIVADERNAVVVDVAARTDGETLIVFSRPWFPGYRA